MADAAGGGVAGLAVFGAGGPRLPQAAPLLKHKVVFLGEQGTGKTSIIKSFVKGSFDPAYSATVGIDFFSKTMYLEDAPGGPCTVRLQVWDSAGQERFRTLIPSYIRDSSVAVVVYDITSRASFAAVDFWIDYVRTERGADVLIALVGNKTDLADRRQVSSEEGERRAQTEGALFIECSAMGGFNVKQLFRKIATSVQAEATPRVPPSASSNLIDIKLQPMQPGGTDDRARGGAAGGGGCGGC